MRKLTLALATFLLLASIADARYSPALEMSGNISMNTYGTNKYITGLPNPSIPTDAAPWKSVIAANNTAVRHSLATAANDFIVGSMSGVFVKKTLAETQSILGVSADGWVSSSDTWTYSSADDPTYVFTISGDKTTTFYQGMKIKLTQTTIKYFVITKVAFSSPNTVITIYGGTDYDLANAAITLPYYSTARAPAGFPMSSAKWSVVVTDSSDRSQSATTGTWYNIGSISISVPIGEWFVTHKSYYYSTGYTYQTLSTTNNGQTNSALTGTSYGSGGMILGSLSLTSKTTYYLNEMQDYGSTQTIHIYGAIVPTKIEAICALL